VKREKNEKKDSPDHDRYPRIQGKDGSDAEQTTAGQVPVPFAMTGRLKPQTAPAPAAFYGFGFNFLTAIGTYFRFAFHAFLLIRLSVASIHWILRLRGEKCSVKREKIPRIKTGLTELS
jgi:hypothetical protein